MPRLIDRHNECDLLDGLLQAVRSGESRVLVLRGEPGVGKSALMEYLIGQGSGCRLTHATGVESEMELAYAALHQLCAPMLDRLDRLPTPQREALETAFGLTAGPAPDRFLIGLAVLSLFSDVAEDRPLLCLIDDLQWLDRASAQAVAFVARRLVAEAVGVFMATRTPDTELASLPELHVQGLGKADARALLDAVLTSPLDERIRDQIIAETRGNPLALLELPRGLTARELAGGFGLPAAVRLTAAMEARFRRELAAVPEQTRRLLLVAAADPLGDPGLVWRAAEALGVGPAAATPAAEAGLAEFGRRVRFRHPLVRSAAYRSAPPEDRQLAHKALAAATDPLLDPDRRAWHLAQSAPGPDEDVAAELERSAGRARARGGVAAAAAFYERAMMLTANPEQQTERALTAASAKIEAGAFDAAMGLLAVAEGGPLSDFQQARADLLRAQFAYVTGRGSDAPPLLLKAAQRLEPIDAALSRVTYLDALQAAIFAGRLALGAGTLEVSRAARALPQPPNPRLADLLLDGFSAYFANGYATALPLLRRAVDAARYGKAADDELRWLAGIAAIHIWDDESWHVLSTRHVELARTAGTMTELPLALSSRSVMLLFAGELRAAGELLQEVQTVTEATGDSLATDPGVTLAAFRGNRSEASAVIRATTRDVVQRGEGIWLSAAEFSDAVLNNGLGDYKKAMTAAGRAAEHTDLALSAWATVELIEAAARSGMVSTAADALAKLSEMTTASGTEWALGVEARARALLNDGGAAERLYHEAIERLGRTRIRAELARTHLLYGEWLRREGRRAEARTQLSIAHGMLETMGMAAFAERAHHELQAAGAPVRARSADVAQEELTAQEGQIARLACEGLSNPEIAARMFISARTVQYHLGKVFAKLNISSRSQLAQVLPGRHQPQGDPRR